jgi:hypothetical protein
MPDITMCASETCPVRAQCRRNPISGTKPSEFRQSWFANIPEEPCDYYWPIPELVK